MNLRRVFNLGNLHNLEGYEELNTEDQARFTAILRVSPTSRSSGQVRRDRRAPNAQASDSPAEPSTSRSGAAEFSQSSDHNPAAGLDHSAATGASAQDRPSSRRDDVPPDVKDPPARKASTHPQNESATKNSGQGATTGQEPLGSKPDASSAKHPDGPSAPRGAGVDNASEDLHLKDKGDFFFRKGSYAMAIAMYTRAIASKPSTALYSNRAAAYMVLKRFRDAIKDYHLAIGCAAGYSFGKVQLRLAKCHLSLGDYKSALDLTKAMEAMDGPEDTRANVDDLLTTQRNAERMRNHIQDCEQSIVGAFWAKAASSLRQASSMCDSGDWPAQWRALEVRICIGQRDWDRVKQLSDELVLRHKNSTECQLIMALGLGLSGQLQETITLLREASRLDPDHGDTAAALRKFRAIQVAKQDGDRLYGAGQYDSSMTHYGDALKVLGDAEHDGGGGLLRSTLLANRAATYLALKRYKLATDDCSNALQYYRNSEPPAKLLVRLARCHLGTGDLNSAVESFQRAISVDPKLAHQNVIGRRLELLSQVREALSRSEWCKAREALQISGKEFVDEKPMKWWMWSVEVEMGERNWSGALDLADILRSAAYIYKTEASMLAQLALVLFLSNKIGPSKENLLSAIQMSSEDEGARSLLQRVQEVEQLRSSASALLNANKYAESCLKYTTALDIVGESDAEGGGGPLRGWLLASRGLVQYKMERHTRALTDVTKALKLLPSSSSFEALSTHGLIRMALGYYEDAVSIFESARTVLLNNGGTAADHRSVDEALADALAGVQLYQSNDHYDILGLEWGASVPEIKKAYRRSSLLYHPDKGGNPEHFKLVQHAYSVLTAGRA